MVHQVGKDVEAMGARQVGKLQDGVLNGLRHVAVCYGRGLPFGRQSGDGAAQGLAASAELFGAVADGAGQLGGEVAAIAHVAALVLGGGYVQISVRIRLAHALKQPPRRPWRPRHTGHCENPQFRVGAEFRRHAL